MGSNQGRSKREADPRIWPHEHVTIDDAVDEALIIEHLGSPASAQADGAKANHDASAQVELANGPWRHHHAGFEGDRASDPERTRETEGGGENDEVRCEERVAASFDAQAAIFARLEGEGDVGIELLNRVEGASGLSRGRGDVLKGNGDAPALTFEHADAAEPEAASFCIDVGHRFDADRHSQ